MFDSHSVVLQRLDEMLAEHTGLAAPLVEAGSEVFQSINQLTTRPLQLLDAGGQGQMDLSLLLQKLLSNLGNAVPEPP